jgi:hypothetical protein
LVRGHGVADYWKDDQKNYRKHLKDNGNDPHAVGTKLPNPWKLYDLGRPRLSQRGIALLPL